MNENELTFTLKIRQSIWKAFKRHKSLIQQSCPKLINLITYVVAKQQNRAFKVKIH